ncbi:hypothetical protein [Thermoanaerobacter sp. A7A]|nr:hypothetical protein [Thermoanaerobacter sp. A7A]
MKIIVPIKQVPETSNVKMDPITVTMIREVSNPISRKWENYSKKAC